MRRTRWIPPLAVAALALIGVIEITLDPSFRATPGPPGAVLAVVVAGALVALRAPLWGAVLVATQFPLAAALGLNGPTGAGVIAFLLLAGWAGWRRPARISWLAPFAAQLLATAGAAIGALDGSTGAVAGVSEPTPDLSAILWENLYFSAIAWLSWIVGAFARGAGFRATRAEQLAAALVAERTARERAILVEERQRIARDLHDSVAHSVSVMTLQVGALRATLPESSSAVELLRGIERLGRESVAELRGAVGILRSDDSDDAAPPSLSRAAELIEGARAAGLDVTLVEEGIAGPLPRAIDLSAFRVLQESLSNALRHAPGAACVVRIVRRADRLVLEVENPIRMSVTAARREAEGGPPEGGHGLVGMRERLTMTGGTLEAGALAGRWRVRASFPVVVSLDGRPGGRGTGEGETTV